MERRGRIAGDGPFVPDRLCRTVCAGPLVQVVPVIDRPALVDACETCLDFAAGLELRGSRTSRGSLDRFSNGTDPLKLTILQRDENCNCQAR
jgi:hypothetical protein